MQNDNFYLIPIYCKRSLHIQEVINVQGKRSLDTMVINAHK